MTAWYDADIVNWFEAQGDGYRTMMNDALSAYVDARPKQK